MRLIICALFIFAVSCFACDPKIECPSQVVGDFTQTIQARYEVTHYGGWLSIKLYCSQPNIAIYHQCGQPPQPLALGQHEVQIHLIAGIYRVELQGLGEYQASINCAQLQIQRQRTR